MSRSVKIAVTACAAVLAAFVLLFAYEYSTGTCGEYDACATGGALPFARAIGIGAPIFVLLLCVSLVMVWKSSPAGREQ